MLTVGFRVGTVSAHEVCKCQSLLKFSVLSKWMEFFPHSSSFCVALCLNSVSWIIPLLKTDFHNLSGYSLSPWFRRAVRVKVMTLKSERGGVPVPHRTAERKHKICWALMWRESRLQAALKYLNRIWSAATGACFRVRRCSRSEPLWNVKADVNRTYLSG